jgi:hypothetical protein
MISREGAFKIANKIDYTRGPRPAAEAVDILINQVYDSVGSCGECLNFDHSEGAALGKCVKFGCLKIPSGYCEEMDNGEKMHAR